MPQVISSVKALLQYRGKYLFLKEDLHKGPIWDLPGGKIQYGESPTDALHREVKEELGLTITIKRSIGVWYFFSQNHRHQVICHTYLCCPIDRPQIDTTHNPATDEHFSAYRWLTLTAALTNPEITLAPSLRQLFQDLTR